MLLSHADEDGDGVLDFDEVLQDYAPRRGLRIHSPLSLSVYCASVLPNVVSIVRPRLSRVLW